MSLAVVTDSAACLTEPLLRERAIEVVPLHAIAADNGEPATTSRPSVQELVDAYRRAASRAEEVLAIHISSALSGTMDNARIAAAQLEAEYRTQFNGPGPSVGRRRPQWLRVVDSGTSSGALGLAVLAASGAHDARRGAALAQASTARSCQLFVVDDLGRLARSGRIDRTTARLDGVLGIRPVLALTRDGIRTLETVRGAARARRHLIAQAVRVAGGTALSGPRHPADPVRLVIQGDDTDKLALLETDLRQAMEEAGAKVSEVLTLPVDEATSTHVGPGALGIAVAQLEAEYRDQPNGPGPSAGRRRPQWLRVVDSGTSSGALGLAVLAASGAHDARRGAALAQASTARSCQLFVVDDLGRLARSGRIDRTTARLDGVLGIRPVLALTRDGIRTLETVRGATRARRHLIAQAVRVAGGTALSGPRHPADPVRLVIQGDDASKLALLETDLRQAMEEAGAKVSEVLTLPVDEATSTHVGPGALGIAVAPDLKTH